MTGWIYLVVFVIIVALLCYLIYQEIKYPHPESQPAPAQPSRTHFGEFLGKSIGERLSIAAFEDILGRSVLCGYRPDFLKNPETGHNLELDAYDPVIKVAIEYNGQQHYEYPNKFHTEESFKAQLARDKMKVEMCDENGVFLIRIPYTVDCDKKHSLKERYDLIKAFILQNLEILLNSV